MIMTPNDVPDLYMKCPLKTALRALEVMADILSSWFVQDMVKVTSDMWLKGWDERNGGNISLRLSIEDVQPFVTSFPETPRRETLSHSADGLADCWFLVTGSGKYFRNVQLDPEDTLALIRVGDDGLFYDIYWGLKNGGTPTSELASHFQSHAARKTLTGNKDRVIIHCHATHFTALSYVLELEAASITRLLWEGSTECLVVFPDGVGIVPWMVPGTDEIGKKTAEQMQSHRLVMWPFHGILGAGSTLDEVFGLIDTAEKSAEILVKVLAMGGMKQTIKKDQLIALGERFNVHPWQAALNVDRFSLCEGVST